MGVGLGVAWGVLPVEFVNAEPADLTSISKSDYLHMISAAYELDSDLNAARAQVAQLKIANPTAAFNQLLAQKNLPPRDLANIAALAHDLGLKTQPVTIPATPAAPVTLAPPPTLITYLVAEKTALTCAEEPNTARLQFSVRDAQDKEQPNVTIEIRSDAGEEMLVTGLKPERGAGYADFEAPPGAYQAKIQNAAGDAATDLVIGAPPANCKTDKGATPRGWKIIFRQK